MPVPFVSRREVATDVPSAHRERVEQGLRCVLGSVRELRERTTMTARLEDVFAGRVELTASQRSFLQHLLMEWYVSGGSGAPEGVNRRAFVRGLQEKLSSLRLEKMVTPDGSRLVSVEEHEAMVSGKG